jgi:cytoskeletal protein RodZ
MEEKLPHDSLEEFLKKSFEGYKESPPGDLWDKIEAALPPLAPDRRFYLNRWAMAAVAAVLLGIFLCQHLYFEKKIERLQETIERNEATNSTTPSPKSSETLDATAPVAEPKSEATTPAAELNNFASQTEKNIPSTTVRPGFSINLPARKMQNNSLIIKDIKKMGTEISPPKPIVSDEKKPDGPVVITTGSVASQNETASETNTLAGQVALALNSIPAPGLFVASLQKPALQRGLSLPVFVSPQAGRLTAGVRVLPMLTKEKIRNIREDRNPFHDEKNFDDQNSTTGFSLITGATFSYDLTPKVSLISGVDYRKTTIQSTHRPSFRFKDGHLPHGGGGHDRREFQYNLNTANGSVTVEFRAEETDPNQQIPDNDSLSFEVKTKQTSSYLSLPLALQYQIGTGKLRFYLKGGVAANFLIANEFEISEFRSLDQRLRIDTTSPPKNTGQNLRVDSFDYLAAAGVEYWLNDHLGLRLEPTLMGSLTNQHCLDFIQSSTLMAGVSAGANYRF